MCQRGKSFPEMPAGKLMPNPIPNAPWMDISVDFITGLPEAQGYDAILVVCDRFTKQVHIIPTTKETNSLGLVHLYWDHVWKLHGLPNMVISNHGPQFVLGFMKELNKILGINTKLSTAYHPQTDRQTERMNQELGQYVRMFMDYCQSWQLPKSHIIIKSKNLLKYHLSTLTMDLILEWDLSHEEK